MNHPAALRELESFQEARKYPRITIKRPVQIVTGSGDNISTYIFDISPDSMQIQCSQETALLIHPEGMDSTQSRINASTVIASFYLPLQEQEVKVKVSCTVEYMALIPDNEEEQFAIGLNFKKFEGQTVKYIGRYITHELEQSTFAF